MKINITNKEYVTLLEVLQMADWMLHAHDVPPFQSRQPYREFEQKILALAKEFGCEHLVQYDPELKQYFPTREMEDSSTVMEIIEEYDEGNFWYELTNRMAQRDLHRELKAKGIKELSVEESITKEEPYLAKYNEEFETHGLERLQIIASAPMTSHN